MISIKKIDARIAEIHLDATDTEILEAAHRVYLAIANRRDTLTRQGFSYVTEVRSNGVRVKLSGLLSDLVTGAEGT